MILKFRPFGCTKDHLICLSVAVDLEFKTVGDKRLRELFGAERENILRGPNVMKLRMLFRD